METWARRSIEKYIKSVEKYAKVNKEDLFPLVLLLILYELYMFTSNVFRSMYWCIVFCMTTKNILWTIYRTITECEKTNNQKEYPKPCQKS